MINDASLVMIPSGYKDGTLYSVKPTDGSGDFTFSRGSNLAATRVNSEGLIEKGRENLLVQSNSFNTTWVNANSTNTSGQSGYDGSSDAWLLSKTGASGRITQTKSISSIFTFSVYVKKGTTDWVLLYKTGSGEGGRYFDLTNGVIGSSIATAPIDSKIESIGNDWYRCSIVGNSATAVVVYVADSDGSLTGTSGSIYIQDAQLEQGLVATDYIETTTTTAQAGILEDMPRLDYSGGSCPSLLLEPQRTNLVTQSEYFDSTAWTNNPDITFDFGYLAPDGTNSAYKVIEAGGNAHLASSFGGSIVSGVYKSIWAKTTSGTGDVYLLNQTGNNLVTLTNEWQRFDTTHSGADFFYGVDFRGNDVTLSEVLLWGAQAEEGSYPTSYIPTYGSSVTRSADACSKTGISSLIGQTEGTMFVDFTFDSITSENRQILQLSDGSTNNLHFRIRSSNHLQTYGTGNFAPFDERLTLTEDGRYKMALGYSNGDFAYYVNGVQIATDTQSTAASNLSEVYLGINNLSNTPLGGIVQQALLFPTRLSNDELAALTTL